MSDVVEPRLIQPAEGHRLTVAGGIYTIKATGKDTGGAYAIVEMLVPPQTGPPPHTHSREMESFYIMEGSLSFWLGNQKFTAEAGSLIIAPPGLPHGFKNEGETPARALALITPAGLEKFFEEIGSPLKEGSGAPKEVTSKDLERVVATAANYGVEIKLP
ncbi:MAG: quercetin 2,3-dioxygenase [Desulfobaccales bacterium]